MVFKKGSLLDGLSILTTENPDKFKSMGGENDPVPFYTIFTGMMLVQLFYWGTNQQIIQRALAAKDLKEGQKGLLLASFIKILGPLIVVLPGLIAYHIFKGNLESADSAYPMLVKKVLPTAWVGFFAAVLFGAILSSFNSVLNSSVTLFGIDIYKQHINPKAEEGLVVKQGKTFGVILAIAAMFIAPLIANAGSLFDYLQKVNGIYSIPILTIIIVGYTTKYVPAIAAKIGLFSGCLLYITYMLIDIYSPEVFSRLHFLDICAILFILNILIMLIIGYFKPREEAYVQEYTKQVDITPWKYLKPVSIAICLIVIGVYIYFT